MAKRELLWKRRTVEPYGSTPRRRQSAAFPFQLPHDLDHKQGSDAWSAFCNEYIDFLWHPSIIMSTRNRKYESGAEKQPPFDFTPEPHIPEDDLVISAG
ncbi:hypothetical protein U9M48_011571, partial [Paspalum notatum var. saurae]